MDLTAWQGEMTTLVVPVPEADGVVENWRMRYDWSARAGVPSHITLLGPFLPPDGVGSRVVERLRSLFASCQPVTFNLVSVERLSGLVYLPPEPVTPFRLLTEMLEREWPDAPRFGSTFERPLYHLTVARAAGDFEEIRDDLSGHLPIRAIAREALLLGSTRNSTARIIARFPFGPGFEPGMTRVGS
jgi:2'-5' RNA ligase superfamily protein